jgi:Tfp pilus assembly protein PilV
MTATQRGSSLIETVIAMGVLAVAIPLVFGTLAESGKSGVSSAAETRSTWMIPVCMEEIRASREGRPRYFTPTASAEAFPTNGDVWALAFSDGGKLVGKISKAAYEKGTKELDGQAVVYIASLSAAEDLAEAATAPMLRTRISLEYPSASPAAKRRKIDFYTRIP